MLSFIILESTEYYVNYYTQIIRKYFYTSNVNYEITSFSYYNNALEKQLQKIDGPKIFIIDHNNKDNYQLYERINEIFYNKAFVILMLEKMNDFNYQNFRTINLYNIIVKNKNLLHELYSTINKLYVSLSKRRTYNFSSFDEIHRLSYDDIYYIEKESKEDFVTIYTRDNSYIQYNTINKIYVEFSKDPRFCKTHRSCIVNIDKITDYDRISNLIIFNNGETTDLVCRRKKKMFCERLLK